MNSSQVAAALRILANAFEATEGDAPASAAEPQKRGRGRPVKGEDTAAPAASAPAAAVTTAGPATTVEADPFATPEAKPEPAPTAPTATLDEVRKALTELKAAASQDKALAVLKKAGGADNLTGLAADKYGTVVAAVNVELRILAAPTTPAVDDDPFAIPAEAPAPAAKAATLEDVKLVVVETQKRTSQDTVQKVVMQHGGKAALPTGGEGPSLKALPEANFAAVIAALKALPATK